MADAQLSPPSYVKYAFTDQHNLVLLFGAACFSAAFASPLPLLVGAALELSWLLVGPRLPPFRDWVDARRSTQYLARAESAIQRALSNLSEEEATRFVALSQGAAQLSSAAQAHQGIPAREVQLSQHGLLELRRTFLDYQFLAQRVVSLLDGRPTAEVEQEVARLQEEYSAERELTARMTIRQTLGAAQKRLEQQQELRAINATIGQRLEMLEKVVPYLKGRLTDPAFTQLNQELESSLTEVGSAETLDLAVDRTFDSAPAVPPAS